MMECSDSGAAKVIKMESEAGTIEAKSKVTVLPHVLLSILPFSFTLIQHRDLL